MKFRNISDFFLVLEKFSTRFVDKFALKVEKIV